ncbi:trypsin-like serine peptidase [Lysobacter sp. CA199]|uniref:trypsin-like serine peptidase n=1 Tax=Lysobacter sp. CA199 TaxID=3455608 RepID=UPI003F8D759A
MKSHRNPPTRLSRKLAVLGGVALLSAAALASAGETVIRTPYGDVAAIDAPKSQQLSAKSAAQPFATARQRAAVQPLVWSEQDAKSAATIDVEATAAQLMRPAATAPGGAAPAFANYLARNHFRATWDKLDALDARQTAAPISALGGEKDGAHYAYTRFPGNYYTSQWKASPWNKIGKLYFTKPDGSGSYCTAQVSSGTAVLTTAAHCVYTRGAGFNSNFVFVPAERYGEAPYGRFGWSQARVPTNWINVGSRRWDVAVIKLTGEQTTGIPVTSYVGWLGRAWNQPYSLYTYSHGYASNLSTQYTHICAGQTYDSPSEGTNVLVQGCDMTYGASGGGWLINYTPNSHAGNQVNSVVSGPHIGAFGTAWVGARFNDDNIVPLCTAIGC